MRALACICSIVLLAGCSVFQPAPETDTFVLFFNPASATLTPEAKTEIDLAAAAIKQRHPAHVAIAAYRAPVRGDASNPKLADPRFDIVANALIADGVDTNILARTMLTDTDVKAGADGDRRVEILLLKD